MINSKCGCIAQGFIETSANSLQIEVSTVHAQGSRTTGSSIPRLQPVESSQEFQRNHARPHARQRDCQSTCDFRRSLTRVKAVAPSPLDCLKNRVRCVGTNSINVLFLQKCKGNVRRAIANGCQPPNAVEQKSSKVTYENRWHMACFLLRSLSLSPCTCVCTYLLHA